MKKPTVYVLLACIVVMVVFFIAMERPERRGPKELCASFDDYIRTI